MNAPLDQPQRTRFVTELERNFSVVASAGSGKTRAITDRIIAIAQSPHARKWLPTLVVVTYTNRAAGEMQQRARQSILEAGVPLEVLAAFNRAFFGTIHSLCMRLLRQHGHHLGLPGRLDHLDDDSALWMEFVQRHTALDGGLTATQRAALLQLVPARQLLELGRLGGGAKAEAPGDFPTPDFAEIYAFAPNKTSLGTVTRSREALRLWESEWAGGGFAPLPCCAAKPLQAAWDAALGPVREWVRRASVHVAAEIAEDYRRFRLSRGAMTYDDQIALASALLRQPEAAQRIRAKGYRVILDEAQDTDPVQFNVLLEMARPPEAAGNWLETRHAPPRPGHFCLVGDFQQAIFGERADLAHYRAVHDTLLATQAGEALEFSVTFRLDQCSLDLVNATFPGVLHGQEGQVSFVRLSPRPTVLPGQIVRFELGPLPDIAGWKDWRKARYEAELLARWIKMQGLENLRADAWREVAILCPRTRWFAPLCTALRAEGFDVQLQSERALKGDSPAYAWFTALAVIMTEPRHGYEIVGVLREVFGVSDHNLAAFAEGHGDRLHIAAPTAHRGGVAETLNELAELRAAIIGRPLFSAMEELVRRTRLRERLLILPPAEFENLAAELDDLLTLAAAAEADGGTLATFAAELRAGFSATRETRTAARDAVQLITCHKAKGSEWQVVIVPGFARGISSRSRGYPRVIQDPCTGAPHVALERADIDADLKAALDRQARQELERLLYVALTRARHTLVLAHDHALFTGKKDLSKNAFAKLLGCGEKQPSAETFGKLPAALTTCAETAKAQAEKSTRRGHEQHVAPLPPALPGLTAAALSRATLFIKRNPSALAEAAQAEADPGTPAEAVRRAATGANSGQLYGTWWHEFIERLDWRADPAAWDATFSTALPASPDPALSHAEWTLLREQLTTGSDLAHLLTAPGVIAHAELPFLWRMSESECLEGIIDLAVFDPAAGSWLIVDWKTNRTEPDALPQLSAHYLPQLSAYWRAVGAMLGAPVAAGLYSTATGRWRPYEIPALAAEWERLRTAPAALAQALSRNDAVAFG